MTVGDSKVIAFLIYVFDANYGITEEDTDSLLYYQVFKIVETMRHIPGIVLHHALVCSVRISPT